QARRTYRRRRDDEIRRCARRAPPARSEGRRGDPEHHRSGLSAFHRPRAIASISSGDLWSGEQAKERGLVDELGGLGDAITAAATAAKLGENYRVTYVEKELSAWERFALGLSSDT